MRTSQTCRCGDTFWLRRPHAASRKFAIISCFMHLRMITNQAALVQESVWWDDLFLFLRSLLIPCQLFLHLGHTVPAFLGDQFLLPLPLSQDRHFLHKAILHWKAGVRDHGWMERKQLWFSNRMNGSLSHSASSRRLRSSGRSAGFFHSSHNQSGTHWRPEGFFSHNRLNLAFLAAVESSSGCFAWEGEWRNATLRNKTHESHEKQNQQRWSWVISTCMHVDRRAGHMHMKLNMILHDQDLLMYMLCL